MMRGRPRTFELDRALDAATELFWRRGYRATTVRELEATLGVAQSSLYHAFGAKADILDGALERYSARLERELLGPLRTGPGGLDAVDAFLAGLAAWLVADGNRGCLVGRIMSEGGGHEPVITRRLASYRQDLREALGAALNRAAEDGEVPADTVPARISVLFGAVLGLNLAVQAGFGSSEVERIADAVRAEVMAWSTPGRGPSG
jgi:AcrR family transcriptional regulator